MKYLVAAAIFLAIAGIIIGVRCIYNAMELRRLKRSGYHKIAARRYRRGEADCTFLRVLVEIGVLTLLLIALFGWMGFR
jgi:hypothetical protein